MANWASKLESVMCPTADPWVAVLHLTTDPGVVGSIPPRFHRLVEIDNEKILRSLSPFHSLNKGCCQLQAIVCSRSTG